MMAMAAVIAAGVGQVVSTIAESSALRSEARQEQKSGDRLLRKQTAATRRDRGQFAVDAFASGLTGGSFGDVFTAQEIEDAEFLGSIKQDTQNRVDNLRRQATGGLIVGLSLAAATTFQGIAGIKAARAGGVAAGTGAQGSAAFAASPMTAGGVGASAARTPSIATFM